MVNLITYLRNTYAYSLVEQHEWDSPTTEKTQKIQDIEEKSEWSLQLKECLYTTEDWGGGRNGIKFFMSLCRWSMQKLSIICL